MTKNKLKLVIQIPCLNEALSLPTLLKEIPRSFENIDSVETLVIDDGSTDATKEIAKKLGVNHLISFSNTKGLAKAFVTGIDASLRLGADIIVNLDGDGQYDPKDIPKLIKPIIAGEADMVIGDRGVEHLKHFSFTKRKLQKVGSWLVSKISNVDIPDVTSGFRAFARNAALSINVLSNFTYTLETLIQAGNENLSLAHVRVNARPVARKSRLFKSLLEYIYKSVTTIIRVYTMYKPLKVFTVASGFVFIIGLFFFSRFLYLRITNPASAPIQNLVVSAVVLLLGFQIFMIGLIADLVATNRKFIEDILKRVKNLELGKD